MKYIFLLLIIFYTCNGLHVLPSSLPDCSIKPSKVDFITYPKYKYDSGNQTWKIEVAERYYPKDRECIYTKHYVLVSEGFILDLQSQQIWIFTNKYSDELCGFMGKQVNDGSYFHFLDDIAPESFKLLNVDKEYNRPLISYAIGINFKNYIEKSGKLSKDEWLAFFHNINYITKDNDYSNKKHYFTKLKNDWITTNFSTKYLPLPLANILLSIHGYEYYLHQSPEYISSFVDKELSKIGNILFKKRLTNLNTRVRNYSGGTNKTDLAQVYDEMLINISDKGFNIIHCKQNNIRSVINDELKCNKYVMVYTDYGIRFYNKQNQSLLLPELVHRCENDTKSTAKMNHDFITLAYSNSILIKYDVMEFDKVSLFSLLIIFVILPAYMLYCVCQKYFELRRQKKIRRNKMINDIIAREHIIMATPEDIRIASLV
uniref:Peptidase S1 domain-containing protein n=1 Tax=Parastrongyloides trichosuri TaxID=131310 RepID=A0A0N4Z6L1_PARTI